MRFDTPSRRLILFAGLFAFGNLLLAVVLVMIGKQYGYEVTELSTLLTEDASAVPGSLLRTLVWTQTLILFVVPAVLFGLICFRKKIAQYFQLTYIPRLLILFLSILFLITGYPLVSLSYELNAMLPMPEWAVQMESSAAALLDQLLQMDSISGLVSTLLIVAVLPALGEELVFRGVVQKQFGQLFRNEVIGIWAAAVVFSAIHFQFEGFLPRIALGAIMGYLYMWTKSLWVPIIVHLFNNGIQVVMLYFADIDLREVELSGDLTPGIVATVISLALFVITGNMIRKATRHEDPGFS